MHEGSDNAERPKKPAFEFIEDRINSASEDTQKFVIQTLLQEGGIRRNAFLKLVQALSDHPEEFITDEHSTAVQKLEERDRQARENVPSHVGSEVASRDASAMRPDVNRPSALEWFFLTVPSLDIPQTKKDWRRLCETAQNLEKNGTGVLSLQTVLQNVLSDEPRTKAFVLEVHERTQFLRESMQKPLTVYDIGCGPFPVLGIAAAIAAPDSRITCVEKNPLSAEIARFIVAQLGLENIRVVTGDALSPSVTQEAKESQIDVLVSETFGAAMFDEPAMKIYREFSTHLSKQGETIPRRAKISATIAPLNRGVSSRTGKRSETYSKMVLNVDGTYFPYIPDDNWYPVADGEISFSNPGDTHLRGSLPFPPGISLEDFNMNYCVCLGMELDLGSRKLARYSSFPTFPIMLDFITIPESILRENPDPVSLEIRFDYIPGSDSSITGKARYTVNKRTA